MENQVESQVTPEVAAPAPEDTAKKGIENTLGVIRTVEGLFNGVRKGSFPLDVSEQMMTGMSFLAQFHSQLVSQLPPAVVEDLKKAQAPEVSNEPKA